MNSAKGRKGGSLEVSQFNTRPTPEYRSLVSHLQRFPLTEQNQAFAEAHSSGLREAVSSWLGKKVRGIKSWQRLFGHSPQADDGIPGDDHVELWSGDDGLSYVSHPYNLSYETVCEMVRFANQNGLEFNLSGTSWYYPGKTLRVVWRRRDPPSG